LRFGAGTAASASPATPRRGIIVIILIDGCIGKAWLAVGLSQPSRPSRNNR
jgi:hypothetical protein